MSELKKWPVPEGDIGPYHERLEQAVEESSGNTPEKGSLGPSYDPAFRLQALATAWQGSCWQQFVRREGRIVPLRSYNNTSVGLMQTNKRVWRQIYRSASFRWNVPYNAEAGLLRHPDRIRGQAAATGCHHPCLHLDLPLCTVRIQESQGVRLSGLPAPGQIQRAALAQPRRREHGCVRALEIPEGEVPARDFVVLEVHVPGSLRPLISFWTTPLRLAAGFSSDCRDRLLTGQT